MSKLKIQERVKNHEHIVIISGKIDEDSDFSSLNLKQQKVIVFDLEGITGINSCGIREWVNLMKSIPSGVKVNFLNCERTIVEQANMIDGFFPPGAFVKSFFIPYYCENCDEQSNILLTRSSESDSELKYSKVTKCKNCNNDAEIDIIESKYFKFLKKN